MTVAAWGKPVAGKQATAVSSTTDGKAANKTGGRACILASIAVDKIDGNIQIDCSHRKLLVVADPPHVAALSGATLLDDRNHWKSLVVCVACWVVVFHTPGQATVAEGVVHLPSVLVDGLD